LLEIVGTQAALVVERAHTPGPADTVMALRHRDGRVEQIGAGGADPYRAMIEHFHDVVRGAADPRRSCSASITLLAVLERLRAAAGLTP
jgi:predicted dehydrogenase